MGRADSGSDFAAGNDIGLVPWDDGGGDHGERDWGGCEPTLMVEIVALGLKGEAAVRGGVLANLGAIVSTEEIEDVLMDDCRGGGGGGGRGEWIEGLPRVIGTKAIGVL